MRALLVAGVCCSDSSGVVFHFARYGKSEKQFSFGEEETGVSDTMSGGVK